MTDPRNVNPYDLSSVRRYSQNRKIDKARKEYINRQIEKLKFEYGTDHLSPYDLGQVGRMREIFRTSRELYKRK